jgi:hypothetical protein
MRCHCCITSVSPIWQLQGAASRGGHQLLLSIQTSHAEAQRRRADACGGGTGRQAQVLHTRTNTIYQVQQAPSCVWYATAGVAATDIWLDSGESVCVLPGTMLLVLLLVVQGRGLPCGCGTSQPPHLAQLQLLSGCQWMPQLSGVVAAVAWSALQP